MAGIFFLEMRSVQVENTFKERREQNNVHEVIHMSLIFLDYLYQGIILSQKVRFRVLHFQKSIYAYILPTCKVTKGKIYS